jgi:DNA-binding transcriptional regulator LsrR (DeoR family)
MAVKSARTNVPDRRSPALVAEIARAYYERDLTQQRVAEQFGLSRSQISRYLQEARDREIVQIRIVAPDTRDSDAEARLTAWFPDLREVVVAAVFSDHQLVARRAVARASAQLLGRLVKPGTTVCFGAGRTLGETVDLLGSEGTGDVTIAQAMGNAGHEGLDIDYNAIAAAAASAFGGRSVQINAPAILGPGASASDLEASNPQIRDALAVARSADIYVMGVGSMTSDEIYVTTGLISLDELAELAAEGAVGDICGNFFDIDGRPVPGPLADRVVGIRLTDLRKAPVAIGCVAGTNKVQAIVGALEGRFLNALVTDEHTAQGVLELVERRGRGHAGAGHRPVAGSQSRRRTR